MYVFLLASAYRILYPLIPNPSPLGRRGYLLGKAFDVNYISVYFEMIVQII